MFLELFGGIACLDFANTLDGRATARPEESLRSYADLSDWSAYAGLIDPATAARLQRRGTDADLRTAVVLREAIFEVFAAVGRKQTAPTAALATVQSHYAEAMAAARLVPTEPGYDWQFTGDDPARAWWPAAVSAIRLLTDGPLNRVKVCAAQAGCIGLFLDTSKNRSRRWCTMDGCGIEAKIQRQASRRRAARHT
ncbi:ABATE domain-containing protein [Actinoplanes sp. NPDC024001]|uniref:CGNR zinc finger domain-containing protein n=1 Tax=Actinoplanes sp. NPDC024001 TaxID=3154598 RepID=UPI0033DDF1FF